MAFTLLVRTMISIRINMNITMLTPRDNPYHVTVDTAVYVGN